MKGQLKFFRDKGKDHHEKAVRCRRVAFALAAVGWLIGFAILLSPWHEFGHDPGGPVIVLIAMLFVGGGLRIAYGERNSYEELAKQYDRMAVVFRDGQSELNRALGEDNGEAPNLARAQKVLEHLGTEAIAEHAQWLILRRARPFEMLIHG